MDLVNYKNTISIVINSEADCAKVLDAKSAASKLIKRLEDRKLKQTEEARNFVSETNKRYKAVIDKIEKFVSICKTELTSWDRRIAEQKRFTEQQSAMAVLQSISDDQFSKPAPAVSVQSTEIKKRKITKIKIVDFKKIPIEILSDPDVQQSLIIAAKKFESRKSKLPDGFSKYIEEVVV